MAYKNPEDQKRCWREHYERNKEAYVERARQRREDEKRQIREYKEAKGCMDCKGKFPYFVLDFDHRDPSQKIANINVVHSRSGWKAVWEEIDKCDVVCANCHRIRTHSGIV